MRKKFITITVISLLAMVFSAGCGTSMVKVPRSAEGLFTGYTGEARPVRTLNVKKEVTFIFWGILPVNIPKVDDVLKENLSNNEVVTNLQITEEPSPTFGCTACISLGGYWSRMYIYTGDIYKKKDLKGFLEKK